MPCPTTPISQHHTNATRRFKFKNTNSLNFLLFTLITIIALVRLHTLIIQILTTPLSLTNSSHSQWSLTEILKYKLDSELKFLPLKDIRFTDTAMEGNTWFMNSINDTHDEGEAEYIHFPSKLLDYRVLCLAGRDTRNGTMNSYALATKDELPRNNVKSHSGLAFIAENHYSYDNLFHGLSALVPFIAWRATRGCVTPSRWILYHHGELRNRTSPWLQTLMQATFGGAMKMEQFDSDDDLRPSCFEEAVVFRHNEGGMSKERKLEVYDMMRCRARSYCNVVVADDHEDSIIIRLTLLLRIGSRSFKDDQAVIRVFQRECSKVKDCRLKVINADHLSFCEQVKLLTETDILASPHGAQMTNMIFMDKNSSVMEFFPKGWLEFAGVGKDVFRWIAEHAGLQHQGSYYDPHGDQCPHNTTNSPMCWPFYKNRQIGHNETFFTSWTARVLNDVRQQKLDRSSASRKHIIGPCKCDLK